MLLKKSLEPLKKTFFKGWIQMESDKKRWNHFGRTERSITMTDGLECGCDCVYVTDIGDRGLERDTFIGWLTEYWLQMQTMHETSLWNTQIICNGALKNNGLPLLFWLGKFVSSLVVSVLGWWLWIFEFEQVSASMFFIFKFQQSVPWHQD